MSAVRVRVYILRVHHSSLQPEQGRPIGGVRKYLAALERGIGAFFGYVGSLIL